MVALEAHCLHCADVDASEAHIIAGLDAAGDVLLDPVLPFAEREEVEEPRRYQHRADQDHRHGSDEELGTTL
jgi:hypothetical protein